MLTNSYISPNAKEPPIKFDFRQEIKDAENWFVQDGSFQIRRIDKNDINKIVCLSEFTLGLKISGLSNDSSIKSYCEHILELIECLKAKESELRNKKDYMRVVAWAALALESTFDLLNSQKNIFKDSEKSNIENTFKECIENLEFMVNDVRSDEKFSVYDLASALRALYRFKSNARDKYVPNEKVLNSIIDKGIEKLLRSCVEDGGYPFTNKDDVSRISSTAFVLFVLGEILKTHKIDYSNKDIKIKEREIEENISKSINYLFDNCQLWTGKDFEATNYYPYPFVHFTLAYVITALFIHKVEFKPELIDALSELYKLRKNGGFSMEEGAEPFWYSTFDAVYALKTVEENICLLRGLSNTMAKLEELVVTDKEYNSLKDENAKLKKDIQVKNIELKKRGEKIKWLQEKLLEKEKEALSLPGTRIPSLFVSSLITTAIVLVSVLIKFNLIIHLILWLVLAIVGIGLHLRLKSVGSMCIMYGVLTGVLIGCIVCIISLYTAGEKELWEELHWLLYFLGLLLCKILAIAFYDVLKKWFDVLKKVVTTHQ